MVAKINNKIRSNKEAKQLNKRGDTRGLHPNSIRNLKPWQPGQSGNPKGRRVSYNPWDDWRFVAWLMRQVDGMP